MKWIPTLVLLAACAPETPQAPLAGEVTLSEMTYHCSSDGYVFVRYKLSNSVEEGITGERCDFEAWRADERENGPVYSRRRMNYEEWLSRQPEA